VHEQDATPLEPRRAKLLCQFASVATSRGVPPPIRVEHAAGGAVAQADEERRAALENEFAEKCRALAPAGTLTGGVKMTTLLATK
jgi:hypothetical protein